MILYVKIKHKIGRVDILVRSVVRRSMKGGERSLAEVNFQTDVNKTVWNQGNCIDSEKENEK